MVKPERESHIRPLLKLTDSAEQEQAYKSAVDQASVSNKPLTAILVTRAVREIEAAKPRTAGTDRKNAKDDLMTQISRLMLRDLESLGLEQLQAFEIACVAFKKGWLAELPPAPPPEECAEAQEPEEAHVR